MPHHLPHTQTQTFRQHVEELRARIFLSVITLILGGGVGYFFHEQLLSFLLTPLHQTLYYSSPAGAIDFIFKVCLFFGLIISLPVFLYQMLQFIQPAFPHHITGVFWNVIVSSYILMLLGMCFAYFVNLPILLHFFNTFSSSQLRPLIATDEYLSFVMTDLLGFGLVFQMPLIFLYINALQPFSFSWFLQQEKFVIVGSFLAGAILTPDPLNQILMAIPIIILYQVSLGLILLKNAKAIPVIK